MPITKGASATATDAAIARLASLDGGVTTRHAGSLYHAEMFILLRAIVYATLFVAFGLVFLPSWLFRNTGLTSPPATGPAQAAGAAMVERTAKSTVPTAPACAAGQVRGEAVKTFGR